MEKLYQHRKFFVHSVDLQNVTGFPCVQTVIFILSCNYGNPVMMKQTSRKPLIADLSLAFIAFIWGATFTVVKNALADIQPFAFLFIRFSIAVLIIIPFFLARRSLRKLPWKPGILAGIFLFVGYTGQTIGLQYTSASKSGFITGLSVVLVPIFAAIFERRRLRLHSGIAVILAALGLYLLTNPQAQSFNKGDAWTLLCAVGFALHLITLDYYTRRQDYFGIFLLQIFVVSLFSAVAAPLESGFSTPLQFDVTANVVFALLVTAIFATALAFFIMNWAQQVTTATRTALILTLEPVFAALTAVILLQESLGWMGITGGIIILAGIVLAELGQKKRG